jgi:hypothetical protein
MEIFNLILITMLASITTIFTMHALVHNRKSPFFAYLCLSCFFWVYVILLVVRFLE